MKANNYTTLIVNRIQQLSDYTLTSRRYTTGKDDGELGFARIIRGLFKMKLNNLFNQFQQSSSLTKWVIIALVGIWTMVLVGLIGSAILLLETPGQASPATPSGSPTITLDPATGSAGSSVTVHGQG